MRSTWLVPLLAAGLMACGGAPAAAPPDSTPPSPVTSPEPAASGAPVFARASVSIQTKSGPVSLSVEVADDEPKREYGLMNRKALPVDAGMLFVFKPPANARQVGFWMDDTLIPLSVAFVEPNLAIEDIQDMQPLTRDIHYAPRDYAYALEANQGWFASHGVSVGDAIALQP